MSNEAKNIKKCLEVIVKRASGFKPKVGVVLGSGLNVLADKIKKVATIDYKDLSGFYVTNIEGQPKRLHLGTLEGVPVVCLEGRSHFYEGEGATESMRTIIRTLRVLGCDILLTSNAVGSLLLEYGPGNLMVIEDHINFTFQNPLTGPNDSSVGERFVSLSDAYDSELGQLLLSVAKDINVPLSSGVFVATSGPSYETPAEIRMFKMLGAHIVGMSSAPDTIVARHCGLKVVSVATITNFAAGLSNDILSHEEVLKNAKLATSSLIDLFTSFIVKVMKKNKALD